MDFFSPIKISYQNLMSAKLRSFLTILGIIIGIASVIIVMSIGASAQRLILSQISDIGSNLIGILPGASEEDGPPASALGVVTTTLKESDIRAILNKKNVPHLESASGYVTGVGTLKYKNTSAENNFFGTNASYLDVENVRLSSGRFFTEEENSSIARVMVLGSVVAEEFFPRQNPIGKVLTFKNTNFTVIGVLEERGSVAFSSTDDYVFIPLKSAQKLILGIDYLNFARGKVSDAEMIPQAIEDIKKTLRENHRIKNGQEDDFSVRNAAQALDVLTTVTDVLKIFLVSIAAISLLVGGIGIMNILLISVNHRIREIGLRKAVGAKRKNIVAQFLVESIFITLIGGIIGIIFGVLISYLSSLVIVKLGYEWEFIISPESIIVSCLVAIGIGILFGLYPARKAAKISPIEALRYE